MEGSGDPIAIPTDLRYDKNCKNVVDEVIEKYGRMDILVNLPAVQYYTNSYTLEEITEERLEKVFRTNIFSYFFLTKYVSFLNMLMISFTSMHYILYYTVSFLFERLSKTL